MKRITLSKQIVVRSLSTLIVIFSFGVGLAGQAYAATPVHASSKTRLGSDEGITAFACKEYPSPGVDVVKAFFVKNKKTQPVNYALGIVNDGQYTSKTSSVFKNDTKGKLVGTLGAKADDQFVLAIDTTNAFHGGGDTWESGLISPTSVKTCK